MIGTAPKEDGDREGECNWVGRRCRYYGGADELVGPREEAGSACSYAALWKKEGGEAGKNGE